MSRVTWTSVVGASAGAIGKIAIVASGRPSVEAWELRGSLASVTDNPSRASCAISFSKSVSFFLSYRRCPHLVDHLFYERIPLVLFDLVAQVL
jgi:hypothetical protein